MYELLLFLGNFGFDFQFMEFRVLICYDACYYDNVYVWLCGDKN